MKRLFALGFVVVVTVTAALYGQNDRGRPAFAQLFRIPGVEFSAEQQAQTDKLRETYLPQLNAVMRKGNEIYTAEQREARRDALRTAREDGKNFREARRLANAAIKLTDEQKKQLATVQKERADLTAKIQQEVRKLLTPEQRTAVQRRNRNARPRGTAPTHRDVKYGPYDRNVMDVWLAKSKTPTPVLVSIHGGGFRGGNKSIDRATLDDCLKSGISVVAITYRLSNEAIAPAQFLDSARAIQFIRHNAKAWNIDPKRIAATGGSAGAGISLWLAFHDDLADPDSDDPVLRESTRLSCAAVYNGQTSYDPRFIRKLFPGTSTYKHPALAQLFDADLNRLDELDEKKYRLFEEVSPLTHLSKDDVPVALFYASRMETPITNQGVGIHHPKFGQALKEKMDALGIECRLYEGIPRGDEWTRLTMEFVKKHLGVGAESEKQKAD